ncbi:MAG: DMT family transporter [Acidimicrobiia bacterium]|nr:DMT family transporter [Acidimicrobiia bacterium]
MERWGRLAVITGVVFWSLGNLIVRDAELDGPRLALWRYVIAAVLYSVYHIRRVGPLKWSEARVAAPAALAITIEIAFFFTAIQRTTVANVTVIGSLVPLVLAGVAVKRFGERIPVPVMVAAPFGLAGVAAVVWGSGSAVRWSLAGDALAVGALLFFAAYFVLAKEARQALSTVALQTYTMIIGIPVLVVASFLVGGTAAPPSGLQWLFPVGLVAVPTTGHLLVNWAHQHVTLTFASLMALGVPVLSAAGAWLVFGDALNRTQVVGMIVVVAVLAFVVLEGERGRFRARTPKPSGRPVGSTTSTGSTSGAELT